MWVMIIQTRVGKEHTRYKMSILLETEKFVTRKPTVLGTSVDDDDHVNDHNSDDSDNVRCVQFFILPTIQISSKTL
jgi:hypothetical protein